MYRSIGRLCYSDDPYRLVVDVDREIVRYYCSLIPKARRVRSQKFHPHITVVRPHKETPSKLDAWRKYEGEEIEFFYDGGVHWNDNYCWLNAYSKRLEDIRGELGLDTVAAFPPPPPPEWTWRFHITLGNRKLLATNQS